MTMIKTQELTFSYSQEHEAILKCLNIEIKKGEFAAVLGHNGSGKSTLTKHFNALLLPTGGKVYVSGLDTGEEARLLDIRKNVGMVFQNPDNQIVSSIVEEDVAFGLENLGVESSQIRERIDAAMETAGVLRFSKAAPHKLSGGQKQRVAIAGIVAMRPSCIVFDEPTAMLDPVGRREVMQTIKKLNKEFGITIILITHYMDEAAQADRVIVMKEGGVCLDDTPQNVFAQRKVLKELSLDVPQVTELMYRLKEAGLEVDESIISVSGCIEELTRLLKPSRGEGGSDD